MAGGGSEMKVLFVHHTALAGGAERSLVELVSALRPEGIDATVVLPHDGPLAAMLAAGGVPVRFIPMTRMRRTVNPFKIAMYLRSLTRGSRRLAALAGEIGARIIHSNSTVAHLYGGEAAKKLGIPAVWHARDIIPLGALGGRMAGTAAVAVAVSDFVAGHLRTEGLSADAIVTIKNGIDLSVIPEPEESAALRASVREELGIHPESPLVGTVSAIVPWKHPEEFVVVFERMLEREGELTGETTVDPATHRPLRGLYVGTDITGEHPDLERRVREQAEVVGGERIVFAGWRDDVPRLLPALDLYVAASRGEPFGRSVAEAMACGVPVVAGRSGAFGEIVADGETGRLAGEDPEGLVAASLELLRDEALRRSMGERGRARAREMFDIRRTAGEVAQLHRGLV